ncbi:MAG: Nif11-like leader peptide family natural product precursor [Synergistaceae bacterium]|nr:Nif11-like leader peptide family natural product precursor [Synergistaceae bacterium]
MSQEKAQEFIRKIGTEKSFSDMLDKAKSKEEFFNVARSLGYEFTMEEVRAAVVRAMDLDDAELESVNGGAGTFGYGKLFSLVSMLSIKNAE